MVKESKYIYWVKKDLFGCFAKKDLFGCFVLNRRDRDKDNEIGLKEGRVIKILTTVLPLRDARSLRFVFTYHSRNFVLDILTFDLIQVLH